MEPASGPGFFESLWAKLFGEPAEAQQEANITTPVFVWSSARFTRKRTAQTLELTMEMPEVDLERSRIEVADNYLILELQYRNSTREKLCMNDRYRRTVPLDMAVPQGKAGIEASWCEGQLHIVLPLSPVTGTTDLPVQNTRPVHPAVRRG
ncbi:MAG: Hsp20/alpha crystallin family protein [Pseudomonadota bacterium]